MELRRKNSNIYSVFKSLHRNKRVAKEVANFREHFESRQFDNNGHETIIFNKIDWYLNKILERAEELSIILDLDRSLPVKEKYIQVRELISLLEEEYWRAVDENDILNHNQPNNVIRDKMIAHMKKPEMWFISNSYEVMNAIEIPIKFFERPFMQNSQIREEVARMICMCSLWDNENEVLGQIFSDPKEHDFTKFLSPLADTPSTDFDNDFEKQAWLHEKLEKISFKHWKSDIVPEWEAAGEAWCNERIRKYPKISKTKLIEELYDWLKMEANNGLLSPDYEAVKKGVTRMEKRGLIIPNKKVTNR